MRSNFVKARLKTAVLAVTLLLLLGASASFAQQQVNLTAAPANLLLPDGSSVPMWGYSCSTSPTGVIAGVSITSGGTGYAVNDTLGFTGGGGSGAVVTVAGIGTGGVITAVTVTYGGTGYTTVPTATVTTSSAAGSGAVLAVVDNTGACKSLNPTAAWSPVLITVPTGQSLTINLTNSLSFLNGNTVPTSITIVGQVGGGLGTVRTTTPSPVHAAQGVTWSTANTGATNVPPPQGPRVQSFGTEVAAGTTTALTWAALKPGTYLLESGTHPSIQGPMGLYGILVVTAAPTASTTTPITETAPGCAYYVPGATTPTCAIPYDAEVPLLLSEIDPVQNNAVSVAVNAVGFNETTVWSAQPGGCGNPATANSGNCYPPAVNYTPLYYMINGVAFNKTAASASLFPITPSTINPALNALAPNTGSVLVRLVNAGLRMHVPAIVGSQVAGATGGTNPIVTGFKIIAEDGNPLPGVPKIKSEVFMAAGKTYDVMVNGLATSGTGTITFGQYPNALPVYDRELSLSGNAIERDAGMLAYIGINPSAAIAGVASGTGVFAAAVARADTYNALVAGQPLTVSDPSKGVIANDTNVYGVKLLQQAGNGTVTLYANGTFTYVPNSTSTATSDSFSYCANGTVTGTTCSSGLTATVTLGATNISDSGITCNPTTFNATIATYHAVKTPGVLAGCTDAASLPLTVATSTVKVTGGSGTVLADANGGFTATSTASGASTLIFTVTVQNSLGKTATANATVVFPAGSGLTVNVLDGYDKKTVISDYRWIIEEDRTFYIDPHCQTNPPASGCPSATSGIVPTLGVNFHTSHMPFVAQGCTGTVSCEAGQMMVDNRPACTSPGVPAGCSTTSGQHIAAVCDVSNGVCRPDTSGNGMTVVMPGAVALDPTKRYYISILPGDAANPFIAGYSSAPDCTTAGHCGHGMGGAPISPAQTAVTVLTQPSPYPPAKLSVFVFEDDFPLNGEQDGGGGVDVLSPNEPGLGGFQLHLWDAMGGNGDFTGQMTYDMFNQPLTNSLAGTKDPTNGFDACPIGGNELSATTGLNPTKLATDPTATGITGMIVTCPKYESDGKTLSPLAGQAVVANLMPGRWGVVATPGADRIARGEEWLQTNTLDGQKAHDSFTRIGEPSYFQEFGPASYHVSIGFANPAIINARHPYVCNGTDPNITGINCNNTLTGKVTGEHLSRTPDERLYSSGSHDAYYWTQCYVSFGDPDGEDFAFTKCNGDGTFTLKGLPDGSWRLTVFDQWNDLLVDGLSTPIALSGGSTGATTNIGDIATTQWQTNLYTRTFIDDNKDGLSQSTETGIPFANVAVRLRDGSLENLLVTDFTGTANFNETFPLFSWYTVETDVTRYKNTGTHVVYDVGGPVDGSASCGTPGYPPCGSSAIGNHLAATAEIVSVPTNLRVPGAIYCAGADCTGKDMSGLAGSKTSDPPSACTTSTANPPLTTCTTQLSSGRIDPPWVGVEGWQGFPGQNSFLEFGKAPYFDGENGGIKGHVIYASTRPFDDPMMLVQTQWEPLVPNVLINLYQEGLASDGVTKTLTLVDHTLTSSFDNWAQGFRADGVTPNMSCPGQGASSGAIPDLFYFSLYNQPNYLDFYNSQHGGSAPTPLPNNSQFKCYDGMHNWNQLQPAPYDGAYQFPSVTAVDANGRPSATNCTICAQHPDPVPASGPEADPLRAGLPMLPPGKYVVEVVVPPGFELVKEEDKNILIGDNFIAPATQEFGGLGNIFILPDQASVAASQQYPGPGYNANNAQNPTNSLGTTPQEGIVPGFIPEPVWPCVGEARIVPDYISLYPQSKQVSPFAGATRNLCDRKEVTLGDKMGAIAKFYVYTSTHIASKFTGGITDDYTSEFDPFSPQFGEKFAPPNLPVSVKDWAGNEISRVYADHWGSYDGMTYSTWEVNPPNPTGYSPTMMVLCMNDPGPIPGPGGTLITDPQYTYGYSQFCYELPFMPGTTQYLDTPVVPTSAFAGAGYNNVDCSYPTLTPAIAEVDGDGVGPWVSATGALQLTITALGDQTVPNYAYSGPAATTAPFNQKTITRHYGFGATCTQTSTPPYCVALVGQAPGVGGTATVPLTITSWSDTQIVARVPNSILKNQHFACPIQQQTQYGGSAAYCGQLVITASNGRQSIDAVTVTVGGKAPTHVAASASIQAAIDAARPGDMIIIDPTCNAATGAVSCEQPATGGATITGKTQAAHNELLLMWKPVRLQGVGAASSIINANTHPAGKLDPWRQRVACLFGMSLNGTPYNPTSNPFDPTGQVTCGSTGGVAWSDFKQFDGINPQVDRLPLEAVVGWDATLNGNLAQLLQEPTLMGALEGAGITVLGKGVNFPTNPFDPSLLGVFPTGTTLLTGNVGSASAPVFQTGDANTLCTNGPSGANPFSSNFACNPSSIDGLAITDSSQGGGGIFLHGWNHFLQIANNRIYSNAGTLSGGINLGQGEFAPANTQGGATNSPPGSCVTSGVPNGAVLPYCENLSVNVHNNNISLNSSTGDELFSATPAGVGGISVCTGSDYYKFNYNWVCGNLSSGDGGGVGHLGVSYYGDIEHNSILFNQSLNPTIPANGGGLLLMGTPDVDPPCGVNIDTDCVPPANSIGPSDGIGPGLVVNANLIMGNAAESGSGGGLRLQQVNGSDVIAFPTTPTQWWSPTITNNIIADNVAGWDGAGVSMVDSLNVNFLNNTVVSNSTTASAGVLFTTLGYPLASSEGTNCMNSPTTSCPQISGLVSIQNAAVLRANLPATITCPAGHYQGTTASNGTCRNFSYPLLQNNIFWQNSAYYVGVGALSAQYQQNVISLYNAFTTTLAPNQPQADATTANGAGVTITGGTGACVAANYWDIGVRGDSGPANHGSGVTLSPTYSVITDATDYPGFHNTGNNPNFVSQYCDGSRTPPEFGASGWAVPAGISDATVPNPIFNLTPVATVDEGNNWVNLRWGPLSLLNPVTNTPLGSYALAVNSPAIDYVPVNSTTFPTNTFPTLTQDFFGNPRPDTSNTTAFDVGATEYQGAGTPPPAAPTLTSITPTTGARGSSGILVTLTGTNLTGTSAIHVSGNGITVSGITVVSATTVTANFTISGGATLSGRTVSVTTPGGTSNTVPFTVVAASGTLSFTAATNGTLTTTAGVRTLTLTIPSPRAAVTSVVTVTNTGTGPLQITEEVLTLNAASLYSLTGTTCSYTAPLAVGGTCTVSVRYAAPATQPTSANLGRLGVFNDGTTPNGVLALSAR